MRKRLQRKYWECFIVLNLICGCLIYMIYIGTTRISVVNIQRWGSLRPHSDEYFTNQLKRKRSSSNNWVRILFWTGYFDAYEFSAFGIDQATFKYCPAKCQLTFDKRLLPISDAVLFHVRDINRVGLPTYHAPPQMWIFYMLESADNTRLDLREYGNVFNWTMTYRRDSDIYHPYGRVEKVLKSPSSPSSKSSRKLSPSVPKPKLVAWVVSNCYTHSNRESYVLELENYIPVDKYGSCGNLNCVGDTIADCYSYLSRTYKFYLAFENSVCVDYVTEKFYDCLNYDMVPVVYGGANYSAISPPGSFIDTQDFQSPKALATYLTYLDKNPEEYAKYLSWKESYRILPSDGWCSLCTKLKYDTGIKSYSNIWEWWKTKPKEYSMGSHSVTPEELPDSGSTQLKSGACLSIPEFPGESWLLRIRKKYFILRHE